MTRPGGIDSTPSRTRLAKSPISAPDGRILRAVISRIGAICLGRTLGGCGRPPGVPDARQWLRGVRLVLLSGLGLPSWLLLALPPERGGQGRHGLAARQRLSRRLSLAARRRLGRGPSAGRG